ncbi:hypothetical protein BDN72DRAFT_863602 [Pluteus cervinus]|uniref:Uncharacterized protein n=1 Tax=Pluteus cervinus TaxID=181527 RepID=A0ACD3A9D8_9AGAR|nr:hypothetical protein BDN72DRAFT_863602 [Pluteus cervinus]
MPKKPQERDSTSQDVQKILRVEKKNYRRLAGIRKTPRSTAEVAAEKGAKEQKKLQQAEKKEQQREELAKLEKDLLENAKCGDVDANLATFRVQKSQKKGLGADDTLHADVLMAELNVQDEPAHGEDADLEDNEEEVPAKRSPRRQMDI